MSDKDTEEKIRSRKLLKPKHRKPYQTTALLYKALSVAEEQIEELIAEIEELKDKK